MKQCIICRRTYTGWGHNAQPVADGRCCDGCNDGRVVPTRIAMMLGIKVVGATKHTHRFEFDFDVDPSTLLSIVQDNMGYDDTEIITVEPNKVFDVVINVFNEEYDKDDFIADVEYWAGEYNQGGEL